MHGDLFSWDVSTMTSMEKMFCGPGSFNSDISSNWNILSINGMELMSGGAPLLFDQDLCAWVPLLAGRDVSIVNMFANTGCG